MRGFVETVGLSLLIPLFVLTRRNWWSARISFLTRLVGILCESLDLKGGSLERKSLTSLSCASCCLLKTNTDAFLNTAQTEKCETSIWTLQNTVPAQILKCTSSVMLWTVTCTNREVYHFWNDQCFVLAFFSLKMGGWVVPLEFCGIWNFSPALFVHFTPNPTLGIRQALVKYFSCVNWARKKWQGKSHKPKPFVPLTNLSQGQKEFYKERLSWLHCFGMFSTWAVLLNFIYKYKCVYNSFNLRVSTLRVWSY